jgi:putative ABC transport system permease protein
VRPVLREPRRLISSALAIVLGCRVHLRDLAARRSLSKTYADQVAGRVKDASVVVNAAAITPETVAQINALPGVTGTPAARRVGAVPRAPPPTTSQILTLPQGGSTTVLQGRLPTGDSEIVINEAMAQAGHLKVGDRAPWPDSTDTIVGIVKPGSDASAYPSQPAVLAPGQDRAAARRQHVRLRDGLRARRCCARRPRSRRSPPCRGTRRPWRRPPLGRAKKIEAFTGNTAITTGILLTFGVIAFFVAAPRHQQHVLDPGRAEHPAVWRSCGAWVPPVHRRFGRCSAKPSSRPPSRAWWAWAQGWGLVSLLPRFAPDLFDLNSVTPDAVALITPWLAGIAVTVGAAALPALAATRVPPLAALRPRPDLVQRTPHRMGSHRGRTGPVRPRRRRAGDRRAAA